MGTTPESFTKTPKDEEEDEYHRSAAVPAAPQRDAPQAPVTTQSAPGTPAAATPTAPAASAPAASEADPLDATREFLKACEDNDSRKATTIAMNNDIDAAYLKKGLRTLVITHQNYEGSGAVLVKSGTADGTYMSPRVDQDFIRDVQTQSRDPMAAQLYLNGLGAKFSTDNFMHATSAGPDVAMQMLESGNFDPKQDNSRSLLYAATMGQKDVFNELMKRGGNPLDAIKQGQADARYGDVPDKMANWAQDFYKANPGFTPEKPGAAAPAITAAAPAARDIARPKV